MRYVILFLYEIRYPIVEMLVVQSWNSHILNFGQLGQLCQVTVHLLSNTNYELVLSKKKICGFQAYSDV